MANAGVRIRRERYGDTTVAIFQKETVDQEGAFAFALIERWGMVAAKGDGEDSSGRAKLALMTPQELVERAFETVRLAWQEARKRGLMVDCPDLNELNAERDKKLAKEPVDV